MPFGVPQAAALDEARRLSEQGSVGALVTGQSRPSALALAYPLLGLLPSPVAAWIGVRALLDGLAAVLVILAARALAGTGVGTLAGLVYGLSPWAWALTRDPAAGSLPVLSAGALLAAIRAVRRPSPAWGLAAGLLTGLLVRVDPAGWACLVALVVVLALARVRWVGIVAAVMGLAAIAGPVLWSSTPVWASAWPVLGPAAVPDLDLLAALYALGEATAGLGVERRLAGIAALPAPLDPFVPAVLGGVALLLGVGAWRSIELARHGRREAIAPLAWVLVPVLVLLVAGGGLRQEPLHALLPALAVLVALATAPVGRWCARVRPGALVIGGALAGLGAATIAGLLWSADSLAQVRAAVPYAEWAEAGGPGADGEWHAAPAATVRFWQAVADETRDAAARTGQREVAVVRGAASADEVTVLARLLGGMPAVRALPPETVVLPIEREVVYLLLPGQEAPPELAWPSARLGSVPLPPTDALARVVALRPRPVAHWLALHGGGAEVRFADGTVLLAARSRGGQHGTTQVELVWLTGSPGPSGAVPRAAEAVLTRQSNTGAAREARAALPERPVSGEPELVVQRLSFAGPELASPASVSVRLLSASGQDVAPAGDSSVAGSVEILRSR